MAAFGYFFRSEADGCNEIRISRSGYDGGLQVSIYADAGNGEGGGDDFSPSVAREIAAAIVAIADSIEASDATKGAQ